MSLGKHGKTNTSYRFAIMHMGTSKPTMNRDKLSTGIKQGKIQFGQGRVTHPAKHADNFPGSLNVGYVYDVHCRPT